MSRTGFVAGVRGHKNPPSTITVRNNRVAVYSLLAEEPSPQFAVKGYDPTWSADGRWLYFASNRKARSLRFRLQVPKHGGGTKWVRIVSPVNHVSIYRIRSDGTHRQLVTTYTGFAVAGIQPVGNDRDVIFSGVPSDLDLWRHKGPNGVSLAAATKYSPVTSLSIGGARKPSSIMVQNASLPAVQPSR